ncbi:DedA family protein [Azospirillum doebereinerae]|uniref:DedA family protein n=1 Tax=Azospirillum doebereinerae TaxID=92933 RepID=A0A433JCE2_9PROT|nr:DedA family protein [Azospirillum doebereinerae]MCG5242062.1 DedA family protein [Azospirillum doebereinerae]RUQ74233.1 DedA family protein [Azospirillum doebereinerae]
MTEWIIQIVQDFGYVGIFLMLVLARVLPPIPAETVIPLAGMGAASGQFNLLLVALAAGLGSAVGELVWYLPAHWMGRERFEAFLRRHGHWLTVRPEQVSRATDWFSRRGGVAVLLCQPLPGLRTLISIPAGACGLGMPVFLAYAAVGSALWALVLATTGYLVRIGFPWIADWMVPGALALFAGLLLAYILRLVRHRRRVRIPSGG